VLKNAKGNIGLNIAAGSNNAQTNQLGVAVGHAKVGMATAFVQQKSINAKEIVLTGDVNASIPISVVNRISSNTASLSGSVLMNAVGKIGVNVAAGSNNLQANALSVTAIMR